MGGRGGPPANVPTHALAAADIPWFKRLYAMVLRRATVDWVLYRGHSVSKLARVGELAHEWIFGEGTTFIETCEVLGLEPTVVQDKIKCTTERDARALRGLDYEEGAPEGI